MITEGKARINASTGPVAKAMGVFYNPVMELNRSLTILVLKALNKNNMALPMAASGVRGVRILLEHSPEVHFNDISKGAVSGIKKNLHLNGISQGFTISNKDANQFLLESKGFDFIDIDPFGSPNPFLDCAVKRISRGGVIGITATDTAPLAGTYPRACKRKYWAMPLRNEFMHETGLRILIRKAQLVGAQYDKALMPIFAYYKDHYFRVFFRVEKSKQKVDNLLKAHSMVYVCRKCMKRGANPCKHGVNDAAGPLWLGKLWNPTLVNKLVELSDSSTKPFLDTIKEEARINAVGFYSMGVLGRKLKLRALPKRQEIIRRLTKAGFKASPTHFSNEGIAVAGCPDFKKIF